MGLTRLRETTLRPTASTACHQSVRSGLTWLGHTARAWQQHYLKEVPVTPAIPTLRQQAALLLDEVLEDTLTPRQAINRWPAPQGVDKSLDVAFLALAHLEADHYDDEKRQQCLDPYYLDAQLAWLQQLWEWLSQGESVPEAFWHEYKKTQHTTGWYTESVIGLKPLWQGIQSVQAVLTTWQRILQQR